MTMKKLKLMIAAFLMLIMNCSNTWGANVADFRVLLDVEFHIGTEPEYPNKNEHGNRVPGQQEECFVSKTAGLKFVYSKTPEFLCYEIYDLSGNLLSVYFDEKSFLQVLFSLSGRYRINLTDEDCIYTGLVNL